MGVHFLNDENIQYMSLLIKWKGSECVENLHAKCGTPLLRNDIVCCQIQTKLNNDIECVPPVGFTR